MIRTLLASLVLTFAMLFGSVHAAHADTKIAYIDVDKVIENSSTIRKDIDKVGSDTKAKMAPLKKEWEAIENEMKATEGKGEVGDKKRFELAVRKQQLMEKIQRVEKDNLEAMTKVRSAATERIIKVAAALTKEGKYDYCLDARVVLTGPKGDDLTAAAVQRIDGTK